MHKYVLVYGKPPVTTARLTHRPSRRTTLGGHSPCTARACTSPGQLLVSARHSTHDRTLDKQTADAKPAAWPMANDVLTSRVQCGRWLTAAQQKGMPANPRELPSRVPPVVHPIRRCCASGRARRRRRCARAVLRTHRQERGRAKLTLLVSALTECAQGGGEALSAVRCSHRRSCCCPGSRSG